ncbi:MAG: electron transfer flavoprotein subunit beta/FixA family protein [Chloroflexi bacterium]|nr:electron transfer flavoprotein subunit beta/FixA family protein [Chloroflexota bacterium]
MKIVACIKYSLDTSEIKVNPTSKQLLLEDVPKHVGNIDKNILETAVSLKEQYGGTAHAITFGPASAQNSFREAMAFGLEDVTLIEDPFDGAGGPALTAKVLAEAINKMGDVDLIVCGEVSDDGFTYQVPPRLAERLGLPLLSFVRKIDIEEGQIVADRDLGESAQTVKAPLPVVISVTEETNTPRRPTLMDALKAKKKPVHLWQIDSDLGLSKDELAQQILLEQVGLQGVVIDRKQVLLKGDSPADVANQLIDRLIEENILMERSA